jgi:hypothetical protein
MVSPQRLANTYDFIAGQLLKAMIEASKIPSVKRFWFRDREGVGKCTRAG